MSVGYSRESGGDDVYNLDVIFGSGRLNQSTHYVPLSDPAIASTDHRRSPRVSQWSQGRTEFS